MYGRSMQWFYIVCILFLQQNCKQKSESKESIPKSFVNCYIVKPVVGDSKVSTYGDMSFGSMSLDDFLNKIISDRSRIVYDSAMAIVTSFERQKEIFINPICLSKLNNPDSSNLMELYFMSGYHTKVMNRAIVEFIQSYRRNIYNLGNATVYEYRFNGVAEVEPHFMHIIIEDQENEEKRYRKDCHGFVMCSDGLNWKEYKGNKFSVPLFVQMIRREKEIEVPLYFDGQRFIPIGHFKIGSWE